MYSQNLEEQHILNYFGNFTGKLLSIGENDGKTFSNSLALIEKGWRGVLVEPSPIAFNELIELHKGTKNDVLCIQTAIGVTNCKGILHESGHHLPDKSDISLLSSLKKEETTKWTGVEFVEQEVDVITYEQLTELCEIKHFDFITIDAEGYDLEILKQIDLTQCKLLCIEYNESEPVKQEILSYCEKFNLKTLVYQSGENLIIGI